MKKKAQLRNRLTARARENDVPGQGSRLQPPGQQRPPRRPVPHERVRAQEAARPVGRQVPLRPLDDERRGAAAARPLVLLLFSFLFFFFGEQERARDGGGVGEGREELGLGGHVGGGLARRGRRGREVSGSRARRQGGGEHHRRSFVRSRSLLLSLSARCFRVLLLL